MTQSLAAIFHGASKPWQMDQVQLPSVAEGEVLVRVEGCTLCGSDLHSIDGRRTVPVPTVLGHEIVGEVVAFGKGTPIADVGGRTLQLGDRVTWAVVANCGHCFYCQRNLPQKCVNAVKYGHEALRPGYELLGGLAQHCLLVAGTKIITLSKEIPLSVVCPASCATATIAAAVAAAGEMRGRNVGILGAGMLGLTAAAMCRAAGAGHVLCVDTQSSRRQRALAFGASHVAAPTELASLIPSLTDRFGLDIVIECTGANQAFEGILPHVRLGAVIVLVGSVFPDSPVPVVLERIVRRNLSLIGIHNYTAADLLTAVEFLKDCHTQFPFGELVAKWFSLADLPLALEVSRTGEAVRVGILS